MRLPDPVQQVMDRAQELRHETQLAGEAARAMTDAARSLLAAGLTMREAGQVLGVSYQRVLQLVRRGRPALHRGALVRRGPLPATLSRMSARGEDDETRIDTTDAYGLGRLFAFSDGVFAIAITLLVLSIPVPQLSAAQADRELASRLVGLLPNLLGFVISFLVVGTNWMLHHRLMRQVTRSDRPLLMLNLLLLLFICIFPFSTDLLIRYGNTPLACQAYAANLALIGSTFVLLRLRLAAHDPGDVAAPLPGTIANVLLFLISIPVAWWSVWGAYALWMASIVIARAADTSLFPAFRRAVTARLGRL